MAETGFGYLLSGIGLGMFISAFLRVMVPHAEKKWWMAAGALAAIVVGAWLTS